MPVQDFPLYKTSSQIKNALHIDHLTLLFGLTLPYIFIIILVLLFSHRLFFILFYIILIIFFAFFLIVWMMTDFLSFGGGRYLHT